MRNLKKMLSLVMALAMVASFMVAGASASFSDDKDIQNTEAVETLVALGIIKGRDTGAFDPNGIVTRAEMAKMICVVMNGGKDPNLTGTVGSFPDTKTHWAAGYIDYCKNMGYIAGNTDGNFYPDKTVTGTEAAKMILTVLGYNAETEKFVNDANWETNINVRANQKGLYSNVSIITTAGLTRDNAAQMIYDGLQAETVTYKMVGIVNGNGISQAEDTGKTLLTSRFNAVKVEGVVVANEHASLASTSGDAAKDAGKTQIAVTGDEGVSGTYSVSTSVDMLGKSVTMYVKYKNAGTDNGAVVFGTPALSSKNEVYTSTDGTSVADFAEDEDVSTTKDTLYFNNYAKVSSLEPVKGGTLTLIDNNDDGEVEYAVYVEYAAGVVTAYSTRDDGSITISSSKSLKADKSENVIGFEDVAKDDYVLAVEYGGKLYVEKAQTVTGDLTAYSTSKKTIKVDDTSYDWSGISNKGNSDFEVISEYAADSSVLDASATFYLDKNGYVLAAGDAEDANLQYAVLLAYENKETGAGSLGSDGKVKVLLSDGTTATYTVATLGGSKLSGSNKFDTLDINDIYSYTINSDDEIRLAEVAASGETEAEGETYFTKGKSSISDASGKTAVVTNDTVFLYDNDGTITRFVGKNNAPDLESTGTAFDLTVGAKGKEAKLVYVATSPADSFDGNYVYVYSKNVGENKDGYEISVLLDGKKETITISSDSDLVKNDMTITKGVYAFSKDSKDIYTLSKTAGFADYVIEDYVAETVKSDYIILAKGADEDKVTKELGITSDTLTSYSENGKNSADESASLSEGDTVDVVINDDEEVVYIFITKYADDEGDSGDDDISDEITVEVKNGAIALTYTGEAPTVDEQATAVVSTLTDLGYTDIKVPVVGGVVSADGITATKGVIEYTFTYTCEAAATEET